MKSLSGKHSWRLLASAAALAGALTSSTAAFAQAEEDTAAQTDGAAAQTENTAAQTENTAAPAEEATAEEATAEEATAEEDLEYITITGYRLAVQQALAQKRIAINARESIFAGDLVKIPDLNLAEAIQRIPGVAISREGGEGRQITLRGLGPGYTRTTLNGMEVPASTDGLDSSGGLNTGRGFDFNVFASELFNRIDINKSPTASIEEGGIAGTVDLHAPHPFDKEGLRLSFAGKGAYNMLPGAFDPRLAFLASDTFADNTLGLLASVAYTQRTVHQEGFGTVRYQSPRNQYSQQHEDDDPTNPNRWWADTSGTNISGTMAPGLDIYDLQVPRLPRLDFFGNDQKRLGITASAQWRPSDRLDATFDYVRSQFNNKRRSYNFDAQFRSTWNQITPLSLTLSEDGRSVDAGTFDGVSNRTESRLTKGDTVFNQYVGNVNFELDDTKKLHLVAGMATSDATSTQYRFNIITQDTHQFGYDFNAGDPGNFPLMTYGYDIVDPSAYEFAGPTIRRNKVSRKNITAGLDFDWSVDLSSLKAGVIYNDRTVDAKELNVPKDGRTDPDTSMLPSLVQPIPISNYLSGFAPEGTPEAFLVNKFNPTINAYNLQGWELSETSGGTFKIREKVVSGYLELNGDAEVLGRRLRANGGVRVARTEQTSTGATEDEAAETGFSTVDIERSYVDVLPSANFAWEMTDDLLFRFGLSRTMTRPGLGSLSPTYSVTPVTQTFNGGNPFLDPIRSNNVDTALEWYFMDKALLGVSFFYKDIESFISTDTDERILDPQYQELIRNDPNFDPVTAGDPATTPYMISSPFNNDGAELMGFEIAYQQPFTFLPPTFLGGVLDGLGVLANYTYVDSESQYGTGENIVTTDLIGLSKHSYNMTLYYETDRFGGRVSVNGRSGFVRRAPGRNGGPDGNFSESKDATTNVDCLFYFDIIENITLAIEGINLTDERERVFVTGNGDENLVYEYNHTGQQLFFGIRGRL